MLIVVINIILQVQNVVGNRVPYVLFEELTLFT